jgi:hypothetical protein
MTISHRSTRSSTSGLGLSAALAIGLIALAALFAVLYRIDNSREDHSYNTGATPPANVRLTMGKTYEISTPGGPSSLAGRGVNPASLNCNYTPVVGSSTQQLAITALGSDTRTTHAVATFTAPVSGMVHIECRALTATFIDDADNVSGDPAGLFLLLCTIALTVGAMLGLSVLYRYRTMSAASGRPRSGPGGPPSAADQPYEPLLGPRDEPPAGGQWTSS